MSLQSLLAVVMAIVSCRLDVVMHFCILVNIDHYMHGHEAPAVHVHVYACVHISAVLAGHCKGK